MAEHRNRNRVRFVHAALLALLTALSVSCAYYNTFYLARKYYMKATDGQPYEVDRENTSQRTNYNKSADYSKKVLGVHPKSKWVDDAWLMWARTFIGTDDPLKAVAMLEEFQARFPNSDLRADAEFFLALAYRAARRHEAAVDHFNNFLAQAPKHELVPYAHYERSKALMSLSRYQEAGLAAGQVLEKFPKHVLADRALRQRAEARYQQRDWRGARADFQAMGERALNDEERLRYLMREVDCLESARELNTARTVLRDARSHATTPPPVPAALRAAPTAAAAGTVQQQVLSPQTLAPGQDHYGKLTIRMGGVELLDGRVQEAVRLFESVILDYPRTTLAAEAQFRIGFAWETGSEDFARARVEYAKVKEQAGAGTFAQQAQARSENLDRLERFRTATGSDSLQRQAEAKFLIAEHFLFNLDRPERALQEYKDIADSSKDSSVVARALTAQGWVLSRKLNKKSSGDSLFWIVVRKYPATQGQLASRDYLEAGGQTVDESLIVAPAFMSAPVFADELPKTPTNVIRPGQVRPPTPSASSPHASAVSDSMRLTASPTNPAVPTAAAAGSTTLMPGATLAESGASPTSASTGGGGVSPQSSGAVGAGAAGTGAAAASGGGAAVVGTAAAAGAVASRPDSATASSTGTVYGPAPPPPAVVYGPAPPPDSTAQSAPASTDTSGANAAARTAAGAAGVGAAAAGSAGAATGAAASGAGAAAATPGSRSAPTSPNSAVSPSSSSTPGSVPSASPTSTAPKTAAGAAPATAKSAVPVKDPNRPFVAPRRLPPGYADSVKRVRVLEDSIKKAEKQAKKDAKAAAKAAADSAKRNR